MHTTDQALLACPTFAVCGSRFPRGCLPPAHTCALLLTPTHIIAAAAPCTFTSGAQHVDLSQCQSVAYGASCTPQCVSGYTNAVSSSTTFACSYAPEFDNVAASVVGHFLSVCENLSTSYACVPGNQSLQLCANQAGLSTATKRAILLCCTAQATS